MKSRPDRRTYYLGLAIAAATRAECKGHKVGCVLVRDNRVLSTGYNGTPEGMGNCSDEGTCPRCDDRDAFGSGNGYDRCICVHAEMNAIAAAARYGIAIDGATAYVTHQPCFTCAKELIQTGVARTYYMLRLPANGATTAAGAENPQLFAHLTRTESQLLGRLSAERVSPDAVMEALAGSLRRFDTAVQDNRANFPDGPRLVA